MEKQIAIKIYKDFKEIAKEWVSEDDFLKEIAIHNIALQSSILYVDKIAQTVVELGFSSAIIHTKQEGYNYEEKTLLYHYTKIKQELENFVI